MINYLKLSIFVFIFMGVLFLVGLFILKIFFYDEINKKLIVLGPDNDNIISRPKGSSGLKVPNLDIEILNNTKSLIENEIIRPLPGKPELLPMYLNEDDVDKKKNSNETKIKKDNLIVNKPKIVAKPKTKPKAKQKIKKISGFYRVQFGSFRKIKKAKAAINTMNKKYFNLLLDTELEIFSYKNNKNLLFYRVWTTPITKVNGLKLCDKFKLKNIVCILQVNK